jgi:hypothetical protein
MLYPLLNHIDTQRLWTESFSGLDRRPRSYDGTFEAMGNMVGEPWPLLCAGKKRGLLRELEKPLGLMALGVGEVVAGLSGIAAVAVYYFLLWLFRGKLQTEYVFTIKR